MICMCEAPSDICHCHSRTPSLLVLLLFFLISTKHVKPKQQKGQEPPERRLQAPRAVATIPPAGEKASAHSAALGPEAAEGAGHVESY